jgi:hypothetical protein
MDLFDTLTWAEILEKTTFSGTPTLTVLKHVNFNGICFPMFLYLLVDQSRIKASKV